MAMTSKRKLQSIALPRSLRRLTHMPLRWALTVPFVLLTVGATTLVGYLSYRNGEQTVTDLAGQLMQEKGNQTVLYLERSLEVPHLINQLNADSMRLGQLPGFETTNPEPLEKFFWAQLLRFPDATTIAVGNSRGGMVGSGRRLPLGSNNMSVYRTSQFARGKYTLSLTDAEGKITETKPISENYDARTRPWYEIPAKAGKATWSPIYQYVSDLQVLGISAGLPVYTDTGELRGILSADIALKSLSHFLSNLNLSPSGQVFIVERSGLLVASSAHQQVARIQAGEAQRINAGESEDPTMRETIAQLNARFNGLTRIGETQQFTIEQSSAKWVRVIPFRDRYGLDWLIVMVVPESDFMGAIHASQATTLLLCLLTLGGAIGLGLLSAHRLTVRFVQLNRASGELAAGNLDRRLSINSPINELNHLAGTFNQMADQLQYSFDRVQLDLEASEAKFSTIFHASPDAIAIASFPEGHILEVNESWLQFFGYVRSETIGRTGIELNLWRNLSDREQYKALLTQQGSVCNLEVEVCTKAGVVNTILLSAELQTLEGQDCMIMVHRDISDRIHTEQALRQTEALNRAILNALPDLILRMNRDGTYLNIKPTPAFSMMFANLQEGENVRNVLPPEVAQLRLSAIVAALQTGEMQVNEYPLWVQGQYAWQEARVIPLDADEVLIIIRDLTARKRFEDALRQSEANLLQAQRIAQLGSWEFDPLTQKSTWSEELFRIHGIDPSQSEPEYEDLLERIPPDDRDRLTLAVNQAIADGTTYEVEHRLRRSDGTIRYIVSKGQAIVDQQQVVKLYGTAQDITDRKAVELALQQSEARYRAIVEDQTELISRSLPDTTLTFVNDAYCRYFQVRREDVVGKSDHQFIYQLDREQVAQRVNRLSVTHPTNTSDNRVLVNGKVRWVQWSNRLLFDAEGNMTEIQSVGRDITELKQVEAALRKSEASLLQAQQIAHLGSWEMDIATRQLTWSEELFCIFGLDSAQIEPSRAELMRMIPIEDRQILEAAVERAIANGISYEVEHRICRPDGSTHWVVSRGQTALNDRQQVVKLYGTVLDITVRKQAEIALQQSENRFQQLADALTSIIYTAVVDPSGAVSFEYVSPAFEAICEVPVALVLKDAATVIDNIHPDDREGYLQATGRSITTMQPFHYEWRILTPSGKLKWLQANTQPQQSNSNGNVIWHGIVQDVTELKQIEAALRDSEERFRRAFDDAPIGISLVSPTGHHVRANRSYCNLMGYTPEELFTLTFEDITHPEDIAADRRGLQQMLNGEISAFQMQKQYITKQGTIVPVLLNAAPIRDQTGAVLYVVRHIQDIRDQLKAERMKDEFVSVVSHELRTPLTSIRGALGILGSGVYRDRPQQAEQMLKIALNNSDRLVRLVNDILTLERLQSDRVALAMEPCQVSDLMQQAINSVQALADQSSIVLSATPISMTIVAAPDAIVQTLTNLLGNAIKFSASDQIVWVKAELQAAGKQRILFSVKDRGRGIPSDKLETIFEQFQQVDVSDSRQKGGTGLGLAICRKIVQEHGGEIWAESVLGEGSTFYFTLPIELGGDREHGSNQT